MKAENCKEASEPARVERDERELRLLVTLAQETRAADDFLSAVDIALYRICNAMDWPFGEVWLPNADRTALEFRHAAYEHSPELDAFRDFSREMRFLPGIGIPGRVWVGKRPEWVNDISSSSDPRAGIALVAGLRSVLGVPVVADDEVSCVLLFLCAKPMARPVISSSLAR